MIYGYSRVSTKCQARDGNSLEAQEKELRANGAEDIVSDAFSGVTLDRPNFEMLKGKLEKGDTLIVCKIDRFARTCANALITINQLMDKGVTVKVLTPPMVFVKESDDPFNVCFRTLLLAFAELEKNMIVQRTQEGKAIARAKAAERGEKFKEGRPPKYDKDKLDFAMKLLDDKNSYSKVSKMTGISVSTLTRYRRSQRNLNK